ncbi:hypothetical protein ASF61_01770 [Duganella sp. Leaf126]|uniref:hypothetical protein n=1 Tax=Duganella sp. Leaf126 TaxID=1736266 RepID=UPI000715100F|nr:hypothetical protein [Duganella sp. Leaf126]KQQ47402.1 hypothetical protein ASF61_01770 [Duganella sp. Leaf126]
MTIRSPKRRPAATLLRAVPGVLAGLLLLAACSTPYRPPVILERDTRFPGLVDLPAQARGRSAEVLLVHGICTHDARWAQQVVAQLGRSIDGATVSPASIAGADTNDIEIVPSTVDTAAGRLRFHALIWSPLTTPLKRQLCDDQTDKSAACTGAPPYPHRRALWNARLKDTLIDDCLPDALIYQGVARDTIQLRMREAILRVLGSVTPSDEEADKLPLVVIAHSMGSKIMFDTLLRMGEEAPGSRAAVTARRTMARLRMLVMAANQLPLLSLADQPLDTGSARTAQPDSLQRLLHQRAGDGRRTAATLTVVAFSDPNDALSYTLPAQRYAGQGVSVHNILVSNAPTWLGLLERPDRAHLDYLNNPDVGRLVACGVPASALCVK